MSRPRGWLHDWRPQAETARLLDQIKAVLSEYRAHLPLTLRQVFYRLVGAHGFAKDEKAYKRLCEIANKARRARILPMNAIRDDGTTRLDPGGWDSKEDWLEDLQGWAEGFRLDRQQGQGTRLYLWCEAAGMAPQLAKIAEPHGVVVISNGGFDSLTAKYQLAVEMAKFDAVEVLHIGDHDPSGVHIFSSLAEDIAAFAREEGGTVEFTRIAVTREQIATYRLPTAPPKTTDPRSFDGETTTQAEALPPDMLASIVRDAILDRIDYAQWSLVRVAEHEHRAELCELLAGLGGAA